LSSERFRSKSDILIKINQIRLLLNGRYRDGSKASFESGFKYVRYAIILLAAISSPSFGYHTRKIRDTNFASYYNLDKVAKVLGLEYERNRAAPNAYDELTQRGHVKIATEDNRTFITFTEKGKRDCEEILEDLQHLNENFNSHPSLQQKYKDGGNEGQKSSKGAYPGSHDSEIEIETEQLIRRISQW
jgi:predicted transcriptional regulator